MNLQPIGLGQTGNQVKIQNSIEGNIEGSGRGNFSLKLSQKQAEPMVEKIEAMLEDIEKIQIEIDYEVTIENVKKYKDVVSSFLKYYTEHLLEPHDIYARNRFGRGEKLTVVKKIEEEMEELDDTMKLLDTRGGHLETLSKIGEISGMIVDLWL